MDLKNINFNSKGLLKTLTYIPAVLLVIVLIIVVYPSYNTIKDNNEQQETISNSLPAKQAELSQLQNRLEAQQQANLNQKINVALPKEVIADRELSRINRLARENNVIIDSARFGQPTSQGQYNLRPISLAIDCNYSNCLKFINSLSEQVQLDKNVLKAEGPLWLVDSIDFQVQENNRINSNINANIIFSSSDNNSDNSSNNNSNNGGNNGS